MKQVSATQGPTRTLIAGDALAAMALRAARDGAVASTPVSDPKQARSAQLNPGTRASAALRTALRTELSAVRGGIAAAADESRPLVVRLAGIHTARRGLKRAQALQDLLGLDPSAASARRRTALSIAKASLADTRQRDALGRLLEELCALKGNPLTSIDPTGVAVAIGMPLLSTLGEALLAVETVEQTMRIPSGSPLDWHDVASAFGRSWTRARTAAKSEWLGRSDEWMHATRKKYQRLADQLGALSGSVGSGLDRSRRRLRRAAEHLGRARDLGLLAGTIDTTTRQGHALAKRALLLRSLAVRRAHDESRLALVDSTRAVVLKLKRVAGIRRNRLR
ncbi:MAG: hypothetical protein EXS03_06500 [Phycisphaerales bacterium]|nr:hypothetical protein [Phycisphaerales bacterium]